MNDEYPISYVIEDMKNLFEEHKRCVHSLTLGKKPYVPYAPTYFMYSFFFFNTLYNIDWKKSIETGYETISKISTEKDRQNALIEFCFTDDTFWSGYIDNFCKKVVCNYDYEKLMNCLDEIKLDKHKNGRFYGKKGKDLKDTFISDFNQLFCDSNFQCDRVKRLIKFIYNVRCNIFHGEKCFSLMNEEKQKVRLMLYGDILMSVCQMALDYAEYANNKYQE